MSKCASSPTARLLQQSRLFSIPRALPNAESRRDWTAGASTRVSDATTTPFPTHQALETPLQSQARGDWGLKRNLPRKRTTKAGSPTIRVISQDTDDHVINFQSASDHERSLAKFHEMNLPIFRSFRRPTDLSISIGLDSESIVSVYEDSVDNTDPAQPKQRWKFASPWVPGLEGHEMEAYMKEVRKRKPEWLSYIKDWHARSRLDQLKADLLQERGFSGPFDGLDLQSQKDILSNSRYFAALQANPAWMTGALPGAQAESSTTDDDVSLGKRLVEIELEIQRSRLAKEFRRVERLALDAMKYADEQAASALKVDPQNESLAARVTEHKNQLRAKTLARIDKFCQKLLEARHGAEDDLVFPQAVTADGFEARYTQVRDTVANRTRSEISRRAAQQAAYTQWLRTALDSFRPHDDEADAIIRALRDEHRQHPTSSQLATLVSEFLGLPGSSSPSSSATAGGDSSMRTELKRTLASEFFSSDVTDGPPSTHPAAGISYLRSNAYMENHPVFGPQARHSPVLSRVVRPRQSWFGGAQQAKLGVGGFVTSDPKIGHSSDARKNLLALSDPDRMAAAMDASQIGGNKLWIEPTHATVDESGRVHINVLRADGEAIAVKTGQVNSILASKRASLAGPQYSGFPGARSVVQRSSSSSTGPIPSSPFTRGPFRQLTSTPEPDPAVTTP